MTSHMSMSPVPPRFVRQSTTARTRIFKLVGDLVFPVTTVNMDESAGSALLSALNEALRQPDASGLGAALTGLPEAVAMACKEAVETSPTPSGACLPAPVPHFNVIKEVWALGPDEILRLAGGGMDMDLQVLVENQRSNYDGEIQWFIRVLCEDSSVGPDDEVTAWPGPAGVRLLERTHPHPNELDEVFDDPRWDTHLGRLHWVWVRDTEDQEADHEETMQWVLEWFDGPPPNDPNDESEGS